MERPVRRVLNLAKMKKEKKAKKHLLALGSSGIYPLNAPGMPLPGPNFLRVAKALGGDSDETAIIKIPKKKGEKGKQAYEFTPGDILRTLYERALKEPFFNLEVDVKVGQRKTAIFVPGHIWGEHMDNWMEYCAHPNVVRKHVTGPQRAEVMVIGKMPWISETAEGRNFIDETGKILLEACQKVHISNVSQWYVTNLCKFMPPDGSKDLKQAWKQDCLPLLHQELRLVRPRFILCLGSEASKELLGKKYGVGYMQGRVVPYRFPVHTSHDEPEEYHTSYVMTVLHPVNIANAQGPHMARTLESGMARFAQLIKGDGADFAENDLDHRVCTSLEEAHAWAEEVKESFADVEPKYQILGIDAEWEGHHWCNKNANVVTLQISWAHKKSICFHLRDESNKIVFRDDENKPALKRLAKFLTEFVNQYRVAGHFFVSDLEMLVAEGFDFRPGFAVPSEDAEDGTPAWKLCQQGKGGLDTAMMAHAISETSPLGLEALAMQYTKAARYDIPLEEAVNELCKSLGIKRKSLEGYGKVSRQILIPYANYDSDVTRRIAVTLVSLLDSDYDGNNCWEPFWESMIALPVILEMHQNGIFIDRKRIDDLTVKFMAARSAKEEQIKHTANWPDVFNEKGKRIDGFNIRSLLHVKEYLFGYKLNGKVTESGKPIRLSPPTAKCLNVEPLLTTDKPPKSWAWVIAQGREKEFNPATGKSVLALMAQENLDKAAEINQIRDYRFLDQVLKSVLRPPKTDSDDEPELVADPYDVESVASNGIMVYEAGLASVVDDDGHVRTHIYPTAETGRWKHARPNLANISKTRDVDYKRLLGEENYKHKLRSVLCMPPAHVKIPWVVLDSKGRKTTEPRAGVLVGAEFDLKGAELYGMAVMSGSKKMIDHAQRSITWPDEGYDIKGTPCSHGKGCKACAYPHPEYYDIHSSVAKMAFKLDCHPSKPGLGVIGESHLRNIAKTVIFGIAYGRQAKAIALAAKEQKKPGEPDVTVDDAQAVIDAVFEMYPELVPFFAEARDRSLNERWLCNCFGRFRRFPATTDYKLEGEFERQAMNFPIQSMIASLVDRWVAVLHNAREKLLYEHGEYIFQWQLQIHDAIVLRLQPKWVDYVAGTLVPWSVKQVPVYPSKLDGSPIPGRGPYYLGTDCEIFEHWGEKLTKPRCEELSIPVQYGKG